MQAFYEQKKMFKRKPMKPMRPRDLPTWAVRPLPDYLLRRAAIKIALFFQLRAAQKQETDCPKFKNVLAYAWSKAYKVNRVDDAEFDYENAYKNHGFMPLNVLEPADLGSKECTGCGIKLAPRCYGNMQRKKKAQKCVVCKAIEQSREE